MKVIQNYPRTLNFVKKKKTRRHFKNMLIYKAKQFMMTKNNSKKSLHILEEGATDAQVGDIEQVTI
jgi:hypothetical protein